ncbi:Lin-37-like protein [Zootermopsis nevadensis]|uniref:Lin-37-like protein n=1 Tax=Zootermopsis nevadensis TaxID=136037 RepID=A0A067RDL6_ZOONE|nr:Lin-37-like protein [Zootermopsis nevadensis]
MEVCLLSTTESGSGDVTNARDRLKGALQELLDQSDDSSLSSHDDASQSDVVNQQMAVKKPLSVKSEPVVVPQQAIRNIRPQRKRRRREAINDAAFHHTYVMKLYDRSVDLAQFKEDTPLYPICRAWMANQPRNTNLTPKLRTPTPPPPEDAPSGVEGADSDSEIVRDTYKMPPPVPLPVDSKKLRVPSPVPQPKDQLNADQDVKPNVSREALLHNHLIHWTAVRKKWHAASYLNEARYNESGQILRAIYKRAQKAFE